MSLDTKLRVFQKSLIRKHKPHVVFSAEQRSLIARHMPMNEEDLKVKAKMDDTQIKAYGAQLLSITRLHERDQSQFEECVAELKAFERGGRIGMEILNRVYTQIAHQFGVEDEIWEALSAAGVRMDSETQKLKRKRVISQEEEEGF